MGKSSQTQKTNSTTAPWQPTQAPLQGIIDQISGANLGQNQFASQFTDLAGDLFSGGTDRTGYVSGALENLAPIAGGQNLSPLQNPEFQNYLSTITSDAKNAVNSQFASAGRDMSPEHAQALGRGIAAGTAPAFASAYDSAANRQLGAIGQTMQGAGILSGLDTQSLANRQAGVGVANAAHALPLQNAQLQSQLLVPIAGLGSQGNSTTTQTQQANPYQVATGGILGGLGLMSGMGGAGFGGYNPFGISSVWTQPNPWMGRY